MEVNFELEPLYKLDAHGKIRIWKTGALGNILWSEFGQEGGAMRRTERIVTPKAKRSLQEQCLLEAKSNHKKKSDEGYVLDLESSEQEEKLPQAMLANHYTAKVKFPILAQPKIDGIRMISGIINNSLQTSSRKSNEFHHMKELKEEVFDLLSIDFEGRIFDGELYSYTLSFDELSGVVRSKNTRNPKEEEIIYLVFDIIDLGLSCQERMEVFTGETWSTSGELQIWDPSKKKFISKITDKVSYVRTWWIEDEETLFEFEDAVLKKGFEGVMVRLPNSNYVPRRSNNLLKLKKNLDEEGEIVGFTDGMGDETGKVIWKVKDPRGNIVPMRPRGNFAEREEYFENGEDYIGKIVTYKCFEINKKSGIPRFPRVIRFRADDPED